MWSPDRPHAWRGQIFLMPEGATITLHVSMLIFFELFGKKCNFEKAGCATALILFDAASHNS